MILLLKQVFSRSIFLVLFLFLLPSYVFADSGAHTEAEKSVESTVDSAVNDASERASVLKSFVGSNRGELIASYDEQKGQHEILFFMGVTLLIFVFLTAGFGIAMGMLGKEVFVQHMVCAGITVFLAVAHSIVAIVWFFPF